MIQILIILCRHRQFLILKREMHCPGNQVVNDCKSRNCDNHSDKAEQASEEQNGKQHSETRKPRGVSQYLRAEDIAVKLLEQQDKNKKIDTFNRADEKYQEAGRDRPDKRPEKRYDIRNADYNTD